VRANGVQSVERRRFKLDEEGRKPDANLYEVHCTTSRKVTALALVQRMTKKLAKNSIAIRETLSFYTAHQFQSQ
jgi:hypothetical protein